MSSEGPAPSLAAEAIRDAGVCDGRDAGVNERLAAVRLVDHHVHGVVPGPVDDATLADMLIESDRRSATEAAGFDTQVWHAVRRWCGPLLRAPAGVTAEGYLSLRRAYERIAPIPELLLPRAGFERVIVETGFLGGRVTSPEATARMAGATWSRVVRLESVAERLIAELGDPWTYPDAFRSALAAELGGADPAVGFKTILAYRGGFDRDMGRPADEAVARAAASWSAEAQGGTAEGRSPRLAADVLLRFGIWSAVDTGRPLQVHSGFGDPDLDLLRADPLLLTSFIRATEERAPILLLHTYPFQRGAGYLAQMFPHVYLDVGLAINYAGAASEGIVRESLELAPFRKLLFSSDAWGAPELHLLGSWLFRRAMSRVLGDWVVRGDWSRADAERVIDLVASENARRVYGLPQA
jgi:predicted TIM-barrel fold metal-dependent hydrolase